MARCIPACTTDSTSEQFFNRDFNAAEIERAKAHIHHHRSDSSAGNYAIHYSKIVQMDNDLLLQLVNKCIHSGDMPTSWTITTVVGIVKRGKDRNDPNSYRTIGPESCLLQFMTLLLLFRFQQWATAANILPEFQNAFHAGYRTNNNVFVLQTMIEKAYATGHTLYVIAADLSNAFPSTDQTLI